MKPIAIIVAGGSGTRMGSDTPKQFLEVAGAPLLVHSISAFVSALPEMEIVVVLPGSYLETGSDLVARYLPDQAVFFAEGGETRFHVERTSLRAIQTPQTFQSAILLQAFRQSYDHTFTDEASVVERQGDKVDLIEGEVSNIKVTWPVDLVVAAELLKTRISEI